MTQIRLPIRAIYLLLAALCVAALVISCSSTPPEPPVAKIDVHVDTIHGDVRVDNYYWLRDRENPDVIAYLEAENTYTDAVMKPTDRFQEKLFEEIKGRIKETDLSVPVRDDSFYYYSRDEEGKQYKIYCRKKGSLEAEEEILLDVNTLAEGYEFFDLGGYFMSPDHQLMAYSFDTTGREIYGLKVKNTVTDEILPDEINNFDGRATWALDNKTFFYTTQDEALRPYRLWRHALGTSQDDDVMLYEEPGERMNVYAFSTRDEKYILMGLFTIGMSEYYYLPADDPNGKFKLFAKRQDGIEYEVNHHDGYFYVLTNEGAQNFKLMRTPANRTNKSNWKAVLPHRDSTYVSGVTFFEDYMVASERENGLPQLRVQNMKSGDHYYIDFPEPIYSVGLTGNAEFNSDTLRFNYYSLVTPNSVYDYNMEDRGRVLKKQREVLGGYNPDEYTSERIFATADDGIKVPISIMYKKSEFKEDAPQPLYLYGYGSYGASMDPYFSSSRLSLLNRGFVFALAHVRGGAEMGRWWYDEGKLLNKMNTFTDFIACAEHLIGEGYTSSDQLVISGGSAGGLLVGAVVNMRPDLFHIAVAEVPFVDVVNTMLDATIPLTTNEYSEWGNPQEEEYYDYMLKYSPYDNVAAMDYPHMLITAGLNDPRVQYWEPAKWTAKLRTMKTDTNRLLFKVNMGAGHGGASGRYDYLKEIAFEYAFILDVMGMKH